MRGNLQQPSEKTCVLMLLSVRKRRLVENLPGPLTTFVYKDELTEQYNFGAYGGFEYSVTPAISVNIEGQTISQDRVSALLAYHF